MFKELDLVVLMRTLSEYGLCEGDLGTIVLVHDESHFEVEFVRASGHTQALVDLSSADLRAAEPSDILAVRPLTT
ncbi:MAG: DUF4926 domain-containing protein [Candidatus Tectomicrobia bacterium]|nr:DUF4926 domain-containing protein [Candidatus Tectomicrobia bacterium]